ncbi:unnamed protein product, partial [Amoebophrya sp. A120]
KQLASDHIQQAWRSKKVKEMKEDLQAKLNHAEELITQYSINGEQEHNSKPDKNHGITTANGAGASTSSPGPKSPSGAGLSTSFGRPNKAKASTSRFLGTTSASSRQIREQNERLDQENRDLQK